MIDSPSRRPALHKRRYIVDQPFQYRLIRTLLLIWLAHSVFFTLVLHFFYEGHLRQFYDLVPRPGLLPLISPSTLVALSSAFVFALAHLVFWNWVALVLTFVGGGIFAAAYLGRGGFALAVVLHAVAGAILFTSGLGGFFYHGAIGR